MTHNAVWGHPPIQRQNTNSKKLTIKNLSRVVSKGVQSLVKLFHTMNENNTFVDFAFCIGFPDLIWVTSSAENIDLARKRKLGPKNLHN